MIDYLEKLVEEREHAEGLVLAEQLMLNPDNTMYDMLRINHAMQTCRLYLNEFHGSIVSGQLATKLAVDLGVWDYFGRASINLAMALGSVGQHAEALAAAYDYLSHLNRYTDVGILEVRAWYNIGVAQGYLGNKNEAIHALTRAADLATDHEALLSAHGVRHALVGAHLAMSEVGPIPCLLAKCLKFLRDHQGEDSMDMSLVWHYILRTRYAMATNRFDRAIKVAMKGIAIGHGKPDYLYEFYTLLSKISLAKKDKGMALSYALSARISAIRARRFDRELAASELVYDIARLEPTALMEIKPEHVIPASELFMNGAFGRH